VIAGWQIDPQGSVVGVFQGIILENFDFECYFIVVSMQLDRPCEHIFRPFLIFSGGSRLLIERPYWAIGFIIYDVLPEGLLSMLTDLANLCQTLLILSKGFLG